MRGRRVAMVGVMLVAALGASVAPVGAAGGTTRWVDGDGHAGPRGCGGSGTAKKHIQAAVDASGPRDTIIVCPGTYTEQVTIAGNRDGLTLESSTPYRAIIKTPSALSEYQGTFTFLVLVDRVDGVTIRGFKTITRTHGTCETVEGTIVVSGSRHASIRGNRLLAPDMNLTAQCAQIDGIVLIDSAVGLGLHPRSSSATIGYNEVRDAIYVAIGVGGDSRQVTTDIVHNSVRAYFGQIPAIVTSALRRASTIGRPALGGPGASLYGIALFGRVKGTVRENVVQGASAGPTSGGTFYYGIAAQGTNGPSSPSFSNGRITIRDNLVRRVLYGIGAGQVDAVAVDHNTVSDTEVGLLLTDARTSSVRRNDVTAKGSGIQVSGAAEDNVIRSNTFAGNGGICDDSTTGSKTAGTANTWTGNTATVDSSPAGICSVGP